MQMELPGKVRDLCQICNWARTVTGRGSLGQRLKAHLLKTDCVVLLEPQSRREELTAASWRLPIRSASD